MANNTYIRLRDRGKGRPRTEFSGLGMKVFGCVTMLFYSLSMSVVQIGLLHVDAYTPEELAAAMEADSRLMSLAGWSSVFHLIGALAIPVFAFLLVEGFLHTGDFKKYLLTMVIFALVSEAPYDLCTYGQFWTLQGQNAMFTYALCLVMLYGLRGLEGSGFLRRLGQVVLVLATVLWSGMFQCAFGLCTVTLAAIYYLWREKKGLRVLLGCAVSVMYVTAPLSGYVLYNYNGERGKVKNKYIFYALYPIHLLVLGLIARWLAG